MKKILIATKNKDKFEIVKNILSKINNGGYEYYSLYDIEIAAKDEKEIGSIEDRAYNKAKQTFSSINENDFKYIIGIDDGIKMKDILRENVKDYLKDIIEDKYLTEGELVQIVRAYCFMDNNGDYEIVVTEIPFKYHKYEGKLQIKENSYPLSYVLKPIDFDKTVAEMNNNENNNYYIKYSEEKTKEIFTR